MKGISIPRQPSSRSADESAPACLLARETRTRHPAKDRTLCEMFVRGLFAKVGSFDSGRRKTSAASAQDDTMTALVRTDDWQLTTVSLTAAVALPRPRHEHLPESWLRLVAAACHQLFRRVQADRCRSAARAKPQCHPGGQQSRLAATC